MTLRRFSLFVLVAALAVPAMAYNVVSTTSAVNCLFTTASPCSVYVTDHIATYMGGAARLQSRIYQGQPGSVGAGKWVYTYRINMTQVVGITYLPYTSRLAIYNFGPVWNYDYNFDFNYNDHVYNSTSGLGTKSVTASYVAAGWTYFDLASAVYAGSYPGGGESSRFFTIVSDYPPVIRSMWVYTDTGWVLVDGYAPDYP